MPSTHEIPSRTEHRCEPCQYHKRTAAFYGHDHSWQQYSCLHPSANDDLALPDDSEKSKAIVARIKELESLTGGGRHIGRTDRQPSWCPLLREDKR